MVRFVFWDVQHGHATYLSTDKQHFVFDLGTGSHGSSDREFSPLLHLKQKYNISQIDAVTITHPHGDHLYDIVNFDSLCPRVLTRPKHLTEQEIRDGNSSDDTRHVDKYIEIDKRYNQPVPDSENPFLPANNGDVVFERYFPSHCSKSNLNNHSVVTIITHATCKTIIPGDNESSSWKELLEDARFLESIKNTYVLLAPHHGRDAGFSEELFEHISPYLTVISDGAEGETSATDRYSSKSKGWQVNKRSSGKEQRKCLTTRKDGVIVIEFGLNADQSSYMSATID